MKRGRGIIVGILSGSLLLGVLIVMSPSTSAAACANVSSFGSVTLNVPDLPNDNDQALWVRMQGNSGQRVLAEINGQTCIELAIPTNVSSDTWTWQTQQAGDELVPVSFSSRTNNTIKIIGLDDGVRIDRVLLTALDCVPQDYGNNCQTSVELQTSSDEDIIILTPPSETVQGKVTLSQTPYQQGDRLSSLTYTVNGRSVQTSSDARPLDTTLLENGEYTVYITTETNDGNHIKEMVAVDIQNPENALTPLIRWFKTNTASLKIIGIGLAVILLVGALVAVITRYRRQKRERQFRGL